MYNHRINFLKESHFHLNRRNHEATYCSGKLFYLAKHKTIYFQRRLYPVFEGGTYWNLPILEMDKMHVSIKVLLSYDTLEN